MSAIDAGIQKKIHGSGATNNETKEQRGGFLSMLLGTLEASLLGNLLSGKVTVRTGEEIVRAGYGSSIKKKL